ncbi:MAG TPA: CHAT domain-containing protein, partial [Vicinamibacteria bacterium]
MEGASRIESVIVEFQRFGEAAGLFRRGERYLLTRGWNEPVVECEMPLNQKEFLTNLNLLRYLGDKFEASTALDTLSQHAASILPELPEGSPDRIVQVDLVAGAAELWAFPFEACRRNGEPLFARRERPVVLTRRIRQGFADRTTPWPVRPRVLLAHAPAAPDLPQSLVDQHVTALKLALSPWMTGGGADADLLTVSAIPVASRLSDLTDNHAFTHLHILAHGKASTQPGLFQAVSWGLRLGPPKAEATSPKELADAIHGDQGLPVVVTVAACDAANQAETTLPEHSFAQELHLRGVPVVLASQLPLTMAGSVILTETFYRSLLSGHDVRAALHEARVSLREGEKTRHDWVSLVGYVRLPEGYSDHLMEVRLKCELAMMNAARKKAEAVLERGAGAELEPIESLVRERIAALANSREAIPRERADLRAECAGLLASAYKRLAELQFRRGVGGGSQKPELLAESRRNLEESLRHYKEEYQSNLSHHWTGVQRLA